MSWYLSIFRSMITTNGQTVKIKWYTWHKYYSFILKIILTLWRYLNELDLYECTYVHHIYNYKITRPWTTLPLAMLIFHKFISMTTPSSIWSINIKWLESKLKIVSLYLVILARKVEIMRFLLKLLLRKKHKVNGCLGILRQNGKHNSVCK
jgi:hypothetical protein